MIQALRSTLYIAITMTLLRALLLAPLAQAAQQQDSVNQPHIVRFQTVGLPAGVELTMSGERTNPGSQPGPYELAFTSPGPSTNLTTEPLTTVTYGGFPASLDVAGMTYTLISTSPASPFLSGESGETTTVTATYSGDCQAPTITEEPLSQTVTYGEAVTLTVVAEGTAPLDTQWYKDGAQLTEATSNDYAIAAAQISDSGVYTATVSNFCGTDVSAPATLTVNKADQTIDFEAPATPAVYNTTFTVAPTASSGLPVALVASGVCTNNGYEVTMTSGEGECTLTASQPGNENYNAATDVVHTVMAAKAEQTITFEQPPSPADYLSTFSLVYSASSGLPVNMVASGSCTLVDDVTAQMSLPYGICVLTASQSGNSNYNAAQDVERTVDSTDQWVLFLPIMQGP